MKAKIYRSSITQNHFEEKSKFVDNEKSEFSLVKVYPSIRKQKFAGIGGALTEASAYVFSKANESNKKRILESYFGDDGIGYHLSRISIQSSDFTLGNYAYVEDPEDKELKTFSIERDRKFIIPLIKEVLKLHPNLEIMASPWSPPAFMKTNFNMNEGGQLKKEYYEMWAKMIARFILEYQKEGITISRISVQNEPQAVQTWESCVFTPEEEREFIETALLKALSEAGLESVKVFIWDHNKDQIIERIEKTMDDTLRSEVDGIALHWYTGDHFEALRYIHEKFPEKELLHTEGCVEYSRFSDRSELEMAESYAHDMIGDFNAGLNGFIDWNILLDEKGGPNHKENYCDAPMMLDLSTNNLTIKKSFYYIAHFSKYIKNGAENILCSTFDSRIESCAFVNPDGERVAVILNRSEHDKKFYLAEGKKELELSLPSHTIVTVCWNE